MTPDYNKSGWYNLIIQSINEYGVMVPIFVALIYNVNNKKLQAVLRSYKELGFGYPFHII